MTTRAFVDANLVIRFLTRDMPDRADAARRLFERAAAGEVGLHMTELTFAEVVWVLEKGCKWPRADIAHRLPAFLGLTGVTVARASVIRQALSLYATLNIDFIDAYQGALALDAGVSTIYSYDHDLDRIEGIRRLEP